MLSWIRYFIGLSRDTNSNKDSFIKFHSRGENDASSLHLQIHWVFPIEKKSPRALSRYFSSSSPRGAELLNKLNKLKTFRKGVHVGQLLDFITPLFLPVIREFLGNTVKSVCIGHLRDPIIVAVVDRWLLLPRGNLIISSSKPGPEKIVS